MAKYRGPRCRLSRREGIDLQNKSSVRSFESKCKSKHPPGEHGDRVSRITDYSIQLRMKQLIKRYYGMLEKQFHNCYKKAAKRKGSTGYDLLKTLESRFDNIVYRLGFAATRAEARQLVNHGAVMVNGVMVNIPSYIIKPNDLIEIKEKKKSQQRIISALQLSENKNLSEWLSVDAKKMSGTLKRYPDMNEFPPEFKIHLVVELYSK